MPFARPTLTELIDRVSTDIASRLPGVTSTLLRRSLAGILARAEAGAVHSLYGYLDFLSRQLFPDTAESEYLDRWAVIWLPAGRKPATFAEGENVLRVVGPVGGVLPAATQFQRADGVVFETTQSVIVGGGGSADVSVRAVDPGAAGNTASGVVLGLLQPVAGFTTAATVLAPGIAGGVDQETDAALRTRVIRRIQAPPQGGSADDYVTWALEVPGVTKAWVYPLQLGLGTVTVLVGNDDADAGFIPSPAVVEAAQAHIDERRPVTAEVFVLAPASFVVDVEAALAPNNASTQAAALAELQDLFLREAEPGGTIYLSKIREAVSIASGVTNSRVDEPTADVVAPTGALPKLGTVTWSGI